MAFQPVPTYAEPVITDERTKKGTFNPVWLSWFLTLTNGGLSSTIAHNGLAGLQGGNLSQRLHLTLAEYQNVNIRNRGAAYSITLGGSPFSYVNPNTYDVDIIIGGSGATNMEFSRDGATYYPLTVSNNMYRLSPGDIFRLTYGGTPTMDAIPR